VLVVVTLASATTGATAQAASTPTPMPTGNDTDDGGTYIDNETVLVDSSYDSGAGVASISLRSEVDQQVGIVDAGALREGESTRPTTVHLDAGETTTVEVRVTESDGWVAVTIATSSLLYPVTLARSSGGLDILRALSTLQAWGAGIIIAFIWMILAGYSVLRREDDRPEVAT
jgi:hypothetical protein